MGIFGKRKSKSYSLLVTSEKDMKSFFDPTLSAYEEDEDDSLKGCNVKERNFSPSLLQTF